LSFAALILTRAPAMKSDVRTTMHEWLSQTERRPRTRFQRLRCGCAPDAIMFREQARANLDLFVGDLVSWNEAERERRRNRVHVQVESRLNWVQMIISHGISAKYAKTKRAKAEGRLAQSIA